MVGARHETTLLRNGDEVEVPATCRQALAVRHAGPALAEMTRSRGPSARAGRPGSRPRRPTEDADERRSRSPAAADGPPRPPHGAACPLRHAGHAVAPGRPGPGD